MPKSYRLQQYYDSQLMPKKCYFIRHGIADHNVGYNNVGEKAYYMKKYMYSSLTNDGISQAKRLNQRLIESGILNKIDFVISSSLDRAIQTAIHSVENPDRDIPIFISESPRELNYQHPCNMRREMNKLIAKYPTVRLDMMENNTQNDELFENGDTYDRYDRLMELLEGLDFQNILIVSHESFLRNFFKAKFNEPNVNFANCDMVCKTL